MPSLIHVCKVCGHAHIIILSVVYSRPGIYYPLCALYPRLLNKTGVYLMLAFIQRNMVHIHVYTYIHTYMYYTCTYMYIYLRHNIRTCIHVHDTCIHTYNICTCIHVRTYVCIHVSVTKFMKWFRVFEYS